MSSRYVSSAKRAIETRQKAGLSLADIAAETGINKGNLSKLVRGVRPPSPAERRALGIVPPKPRGIRVRMSTTEARAVWFALSSTSHGALRERITMALIKANYYTAKPEAHVNSQ